MEFMKKQVYKPKEGNVNKLKEFYLNVVKNESTNKNTSKIALFKK